jgi:hypothetical protein
VPQDKGNAPEEKEISFSAAVVPVVGRLHFGLANPRGILVVFRTYEPEQTLFGIGIQLGCLPGTAGSNIYPDPNGFADAAN